MASKYGVEYTNLTQDVPAEMPPPNKYGGRIRAVYDTYALSADLAAGDKIYMGKLPKGARVIDVILAFDALGAGTLDVGYEYADTDFTSDPDAFIDGVAVTSAGNKAMSAEGANRAGFGYEIEDAAEIIVTVATDTSASSGTIKCCVLYAMA